LNLVEGWRIGLAGHRRRWPGAELCRVVQYKGGHVRPVGENGCRELWRCELVVARLVARHKGLGRGGGTVIGADGDQARGNGLADLDALLFARSVGDHGELTAE